MQQVMNILGVACIALVARFAFLKKFPCKSLLSVLQKNDITSIKEKGTVRLKCSKLTIYYTRIETKDHISEHCIFPDEGCILTAWWSFGILRTIHVYVDGAGSQFCQNLTTNQDAAQILLLIRQAAKTEV